MRYKINEKLKAIIWKNRKILNNFLHNYKNWLYVNKSISEEHLLKLCKTIKLNKKELNLKKFILNYKKNLGKYTQAHKINFKGINRNFAEFLGIVLGDGHLHKNGVDITINKNEIDYKIYIKSLFSVLFNYNLKEREIDNKDCIKLYTYSKTLVQLLSKYGLKIGNKVKNNVGIPNWIKNKPIYTKKCIRGLVDTDGSVYFSKRDKKIYLKFTSKSSQLLIDFLQCTKIIGLNFVHSGKDSLAIYRTKELKKYVNIVGFSNKKHIDRYNTPYKQYIYKDKINHSF